MKKTRLALFAAAALTVGLFHPGQALAVPTIENGSFEDPAYTDDGTYRNTAGTGWQPSVQAPIGIVRGNIVDNNNNFIGVTPYGDQYLVMDSRSATGQLSRVSQVLHDFVAGQTYALTLGVADLDFGSNPVLDVAFGVDDASVPLYLDQQYNVPFGGPYGDVIPFNLVTVDFTAPVSGDIILFLNNASIYPGPPNSFGIDNVSIAAVPEPGTVAATLLGAGALVGGLIRRRQKKA